MYMSNGKALWNDVANVMFRNTVSGIILIIVIFYIGLADHTGCSVYSSVTSGLTAVFTWNVLAVPILVPVTAVNIPAMASCQCSIVHVLFIFSGSKTWCTCAVIFPVWSYFRLCQCRILVKFAINWSSCFWPPWQDCSYNFWPPDSLKFMERAWQWREGKTHVKCWFWALLVSGGLGAARKAQSGTLVSGTRELMLGDRPQQTQPCFGGMQGCN